MHRIQNQIFFQINIGVIILKKIIFFRAVSSKVEYCIDIAGVVGSLPTQPTINDYL